MTITVTDMNAIGCDVFFATHRGVRAGSSFVRSMSEPSESICSRTVSQFRSATRLATRPTR